MLALALLAPAIAILPMKDVDGDGPTSAAIRAILSSDLGEAPELKVLPRLTLEVALGKLKLDARRTELDPASLVKLGRALHVNVLVTGAFEAHAGEVKIWARFVKGESGKVIGTSTVKGPPADFLLLLNTVEAELLRTVEAERNAITRVAYRVRPRLRSTRTMALYGQAAEERDDERRRSLLQQALDEDPTFDYAQRELDALERRLPSRSAYAMSEQERQRLSAIEKLKAQIATEKDPARIVDQVLARWAELQKQRRWRLLIAEAGAVVAHPPPPVPELAEQLPESAQFLIVAAYDQLNDDDTLLREGQRFLARFPLSDGFVGVRQLVDQALERKKQREDGVATSAAALGQLPAAERADPCRVASVQEEHHQLKDARSSYESCTRAPHHEVELMRLLWIDWRLGDFGAASVILGRLRSEAPAAYQKVMKLAEELPVD